MILAMVVSDSSKGACFLFMNSSRRLEFLLRVDGFGFFLTGSFPLVSKERGGVQGKGEAGANIEGEFKSQALARQRLAEVQRPGRINFHPLQSFWYTSELGII